MLMHTIYVIEHIRTGKCYVGRSSSISERRKAHLWTPMKKILIGREIRRLGADEFAFREVARTEDGWEAAKLERFWIHLMEANDANYGYNSPRFYPIEPLPTIEDIKQHLSKKYTICED